MLRDVIVFTVLVTLIAIALTACAGAESAGARYWPCRSWEIPFERYNGVTVCLGGDAVEPPRAVPSEVQR